MHATSSDSLSSQVHETCRAFLSNRKGVAVVIQVFMDESGIHHGSDIVAVSAVWAEAEAWGEWTKDWIVAKHPVNIYHAVDCHNVAGEFKSWSRNNRDEFVRKTLAVIRDHEISGHFAALDVGELTKILREDYGLSIGQKQTIEDGYYYCVSWAIRAAWEYLSERGHENIAFIHEQNEFMSVALLSFEYLKKANSRFKGTLAFATKEDFEPLQCADIIAYEGNREMRGGLKPNRRWPLRFIDPNGNRFGYVKRDKNEMTAMASFYAKHRDSLPSISSV